MPPPTPLPPPDLHHRTEDGQRLPYLVWRFAEGRRVITSAPVGGGIGERDWIINAQVRSGYDRTDLAAHVLELATGSGLEAGRGAAMLTAADVSGARTGHDGGVDVVATVGIRVPTWAAAPEGHADPVVVSAPGGTAPVPSASALPPPGTINIVVLLPVAMSDAALVNLVATTTEAKTQALLHASIPGTGTATDTVCIVCPPPATGSLGSDRSGDEVERFGGPRSPWGGRVARATYEAVRSGIDGSLRIIENTDDAGGPDAGVEPDADGLHTRSPDGWGRR